MEKIVTVKTFDIEIDGFPTIENLKTFEEAEAYIIAHDAKEHADWQLAFYKDPERTNEYKRHRYIIYHAEGKVATDDASTQMSFEDLCDEAFSWYVISVVEFKF